MQRLAEYREELDLFRREIGGARSLPDVSFFLFVSDGIYVFTTELPESYAIPTEARGGAELWGEILRRQLFDAELAIEAACSEGGLYCWPPDEAAQ